jgi:hypothetical protein
MAYFEAMWYYARGVACGARGKANAVETLERTANFRLLISSNIPAQDALKLARSVIASRVFQARGDLDAAIAQFEQAASAAGWLASAWRDEAGDAPARMRMVAGKRGDQRNRTDASF